MILGTIRVLIAATIGVIIAKRVIIPLLDDFCDWLCDLF